MSNTGLYNLTNPQKGIWLMEQYYKETPINNICGSLLIKQKVDFTLFSKAINIVIKNNDNFKIRLKFSQNNICQFFVEDKIYNFELIHFSRESDIDFYAKKMVNTPFNVENSCLFHFILFDLPNGFGGLILNIHHIISDAASTAIISKEIVDTYLKLLNKENISQKKYSYLDYIHSEKEYLNSIRFSKDESFWNNKFNSLPELASIPSIKPASALSGNSLRKQCIIDNVLLKKIKNFCAMHNISIYNFLVAVYSIYIGNINNISDFCLGTPILNRTSINEKNTCGMFININLLRIDMQNNSTFVDFAKEISHLSLSMLRHQKYPYHKILESIRKDNNSLAKLYDIMFSYQITQSTDASCKIPFETKWFAPNYIAESLYINFHDNNCTGNLLVEYDYQLNKYCSKDIKLLHNRIIDIINQVLEKPSIHIQNIDILSKEEKYKILYNFNNTFSDYPKDKNIVQLFEEQSVKNPNNIAVIFKNKKLTYKELNQKANCLAKEILKQNISTDVIAFCLKRSPNIIITILAILKSGHTYMPIDPDYPIDRINYMIKHSNSKLLISTPDSMPNINYTEKLIDFNSINFSQECANLNLPISSSVNAYIMYTSGSTGKPKGVTIKHYNVINFAYSLKSRLDYTPSENNNVLSVTTVCFDIFVGEIFPTLILGLTLVISDETEAKSPKLLSELIVKQNISKILTTPSRIELLFTDKKYYQCLENVKEFILGGEPLSKTTFKKLKKITSGKIIDMYGPTETTVYSTFKDLTNQKQITIGKPINNTHIYILNDCNNLMPINTVGEIAISGDGVGNGYYNDAEKTRKVFIPNHFTNNGLIYKTGDLGYFMPDGELICLGRKDFQVKIRGYRIELTDITSNILLFPNIDECIVIDKTEKDGSKCIAAFIKSSQEIDINLLKKFLFDKLPNYMIPKYIVQLEQFPLTINHKIDKKVLSNMHLEAKKQPTNQPIKKPYTDLQAKFSKVLCKELNLKELSIDTDLFDFNIDSLAIIRIQTRLLSKYNIKINTGAFYKYRTIEKMANSIDNLPNSASEFSNYDDKNLLNINNSFHKHSLNKFIMSNNQYKHILLIGSTGYLGIHLLHELYENTTSTITCIIRHKNNSENRLFSLYKFYFNTELDFNRIKIIYSDIKSSNFGLSDKQYKVLFNTIDLVINSAANVRYYGDYTEFKKINVDVVKNCINFCLNSSKKLVHISTLGVSGNYLVGSTKNNITFTENDFYIGQKFMDNIYVRTKFEAEKLIYENTPKGLDATIFRVGNLTGRYCDGHFQQNISENAFYNILRIMLKYNIISKDLFKQDLEFTPVDLCAKCIIEILNNINTSKYVYHIFNNNYISVNQFIHLISVLDYKPQILDSIDFKNRLLKLSNQNESENILMGIINDISSSGVNFRTEVIQKNEYTNNVLEALQIKWPNIDELYLQKIINYMKVNKYI